MPPGNLDARLNAIEDLIPSQSHMVAEMGDY
jgi:hypothetical protein